MCVCVLVRSVRARARACVCVCVCLNPPRKPKDLTLWICVTWFQVDTSRGITSQFTLPPPPFAHGAVKMTTALSCMMLASKDPPPMGVMKIVAFDIAYASSRGFVRDLKSTTLTSTPAYRARRNAASGSSFMMECRLALCRTMMVSFLRWEGERCGMPWLWKTRSRWTRSRP